MIKILKDMIFDKRTAARDSFSIYRTNHLNAALLEALADRQWVKPNEFIGRIMEQTNQEIGWSITLIEAGDALKYLAFIGIIQAREHLSVCITDLGLTALQDCRFQQLAATSYFNYRSLKNTEWLVLLAPPYAFQLWPSLLAFLKDSYCANKFIMGYPCVVMIRFQLNV